MTADKLIASARACIGTRFQHQGRIPGMALDCAGLIIFVAADNGAEYRDVQGYSRTPSHQQLKGALDDQPCLIPVDVRQPGDVLLMRFTGDPQHLALFAGQTIIHSYEGAGQVCEHDLDAAWAARIVRAYRFKDLS